MGQNFNFPILGGDGGVIFYSSVWRSNINVIVLFFGCIASPNLHPELILLSTSEGFTPVYSEAHSEVVVHDVRRWIKCGSLIY